MLMKAYNQSGALLSQIKDTLSFVIGWPYGEAPAVHLSLFFVLRNVLGVRLGILRLINLYLNRLRGAISLNTFVIKLN